MTAEQQKAHLRMLTFLPIRTHQGWHEETEGPNHGIQQPVLVKGRMYRCKADAMKALKMTKYALDLLIKRGSARIIHEPQSDGIPTFKSSTGCKASKAKLRRREREAAK